jgi:fucose 4-O-acetylase-like acetyltransferase
MPKLAKDLRVETARGLAAFLVVAGHVIGPSGHEGMHVGDGSTLRYLYRALLMLRLPLFTVLSGYVYAMRPVDRAHLAEFMDGKVRRLLLPMVSMGAVFLIVRYYTPGVSVRPSLPDLLLIPFFPHAHFWYLHSLFVVFLVISALEVAGALKRFWSFAMVFAASGFLLATPVCDIAFFGIGGAPYLLIFFLWGLALRRFADVLNRHAILVALAVGSIALIAVHELGILGVVSIGTNDVAFVTVLGGLCTNAWLIYRGPTWAAIARIGNYSFSIFLMHVFGTAAARVLLNKAGVTSDALHFVAGVSAGLFLPILAERLLDSYAITRFVFLGREYVSAAVPRVVLSRLAITGTLAAGATALPPAQAEVPPVDARVADDDKRLR